MSDSQTSRTPLAAKSMSVAEAKANFSALINDVCKKHTPVTILRRGVPMVQVVPLADAPRPQLRGSMAGTVRILGDIINTNWDEWTVGDWPENQPAA